jgi:hypothetical protein
MKFIGQTTFFLLLIGIAIPSIGANPKTEADEATLDSQWQNLDKGLELGIFASPRPSEVGDSLIRILRIDPNRFEFKLLNASAPGQGRSLTAKKWCLQNGLVAAINASMYQTDYKTSVSLMRSQIHVNNPRLSKDMSILAFDRQSLAVPLVKIIDRQCEDFYTWKNKYGTLVQSIRMISCKGRNVWSQQPKKWSTAAIGIDHQEKVLFIHVRSPYSTHDLINIIKMLPVDISRAMYAEGGPEAQLYIRTGGKEYEFTGNSETFFNENSDNKISWPVPNVVGITTKGNSKKSKPNLKTITGQ